MIADSAVAFDKSSLLDALSESRRRVSAFFEALPADAFLDRPEGKWSPADHWRHLVKAVRPVALALRLPRPLLRLLFGKPKRDSRGYDEIRRVYRAALAAGGQAGRFAPVLEKVAAERAEDYRENIRRDWWGAGDRLTTALAAWRDADLDAFQLPHPILGKLTLREMILFTLYHNLHHVENVRNRLGPTESTGAP